MLGVTDLWTFVLGSIAIVLLPGPNSLYVLSTAAQRGVRAGYRASAGVFLGDSVLMFASAAGVASLLRAFPVVFTVLKWAGAAYLAYLGVRMLVAGLRRVAKHAAGQGAGEGTVDHMAVHQVTADRIAADQAAGDQADPFRKGLTISLINPKSILFFVSFFVQFVDPVYAYPALSFLLLATIAQVFSVLYMTALIFGGNYLAALFRRSRALARAGTSAVGAIFIGFSVKLATASTL